MCSNKRESEIITLTKLTMSKIDKITACLPPIVIVKKYKEADQPIEFLYLFVAVVPSWRNKNVHISSQSTRLLHKAEMIPRSKIRSRLDR